MSVKMVCFNDNDIESLHREQHCWVLLFKALSLGLTDGIRNWG